MFWRMGGAAVATELSRGRFGLKFISVTIKLAAYVSVGVCVHLHENHSSWGAGAHIHHSLCEKRGTPGQVNNRAM